MSKKAKRKAKPTPELAAKRVRISPEMVALSKRKVAAPEVVTFNIPKPAPGVVPDGMAMDEGGAALSSWANGSLIGLGGLSFGGLVNFIGYPFLAELAQRPEYRRISECIATEMTRKWIRITARGGQDKSDEIEQVNLEFERLKVRECFQKACILDGFFGRSHLYLDIGDAFKDRAELILPIGDGRDKLSAAKVKKGGLRYIKVIEPTWTYPTQYNSNDPLKEDWYRPDSWFVLGKQVHGSRLLTFVGREVPDMLKPCYMFGGLSMSQMAMPYVNNWLRTRQSVADIISAFSTFVLATNMSETTQVGGEQLFARAELFNNLRDNRGLLMIDKDLEDFKNVAAPLGSLDALQAQTQEHMASVSGVPIVKLLGIQPAGLNASSQGELESFYTNIGAFQEHLFREPLTRILGFAQLNVLGRVDPDITFTFEPLWSLTDKELAEVEKLKSETDAIKIDSSVISPMEARKRTAADPESDYNAIEVEDAPDLLEEEEEGIEPKASAEKLAEAAETGETAPDAESKRAA